MLQHSPAINQSWCDVIHPPTVPSKSSRVGLYFQIDFYGGGEYMGGLTHLGKGYDSTVNITKAISYNIVFFSSSFFRKQDSLLIVLTK